MRNVLFRPPECRPWWKRKPGLWRLGEEEGWCRLAVIAKESRRGDRGLPLQLGFKGLLPGTKIKISGTHQSLPYILASVTASDGAGFIALVLVCICVSANLWMGSCVCCVLLIFLFVLKSQTEVSRRHMSLSEPALGTCDHSRSC